MKNIQVIERFCAASFRADLPPSPTASVANIARRASIRLRDRWFYFTQGICVAFFAAGFLLAGVLANHTLLVLLGFLGFVYALGLSLRLAPAKLMEQTLRAEAEAERTVGEYADLCQSKARSFASAAIEATKRELQSAMRDGATLAEMTDWKEEAKDAFLSIRSECATAMTANQAQGNAAQEDLQRKRGQLNAACQSWKAMFIPGPARRAAREVLNAISKCCDFRLAEATSKAELQAFQAILEGLDMLPTVQAIEAQASLCQFPEMPIWIGTAVPSPEILRSAAIERVDANIKLIREKIIAASGQQSPEQVVQQEIDQIFQGSLPGAKSVEEHVSSLNGDGKEWAERVRREALPFSPLTPHVGRVRHCKSWCMTANGADSAVFRNLKGSLSDQATKLFALEGSSSQMLFFDEERGVTPGEFDELPGLFDAFRSLPPREQRLLCTACDPDDLINFYPERGRDENRPLRLLACALVFGLISRNGAELYMFCGEVIGKGFGSTFEAIKVDQRLAVNIASKLETTMSSEGSAAAAAKLKSAREQASSFAPKGFLKTFQAGMDDALGELNRRGAAIR